ncbi:MAG: beta-ketoacyl-[acyl-carrier-protein] synthase family protein [Polyangiaceae bacterium]|nr:beta-ketoacyl-[acyl-carrier-protein] synthase family protein [Polyangiaceae bacterium]
MLPRVFVSGVGVVSSIGLGKKEFYRSLSQGKSGISPIESFDATNLGRHFAGEVKAFRTRDHLSAAENRRMGRCGAMTLAAARMAVEDAGMDPAILRGPRTAVVLGTTMGEATLFADLDASWIHDGADAVKSALIPKYGSTLLPIHVARAFGAQGMVLALPAACAAGNYALGFAMDLIRSGRFDRVIAGASEVLQELQFNGFVRLAAMAHERCQPFDLNRQGLIVGEGSGMFVLESEESLVRRGGTPQVEIGGYGISCDAYHITRPREDATGSIAAMSDAIRYSGLSANDIDFINAHGTGTKANDVAEALVVRTVFGDRRVPISSVKSMIGHCMGAASALEAAACVMTLETGLYPPTIGFETPDPECALNVVANTAAEGPANIVLNNSLAFGGYNAVTCLARVGVLPVPAPVSRGPRPLKAA